MKKLKILWLIYSLCSLAFAQVYIGCYRSSVSDPELLPNVVAKRIQSVPDCIQECRARYHKYAGLMNGHQCYCDSHYGRDGPSDNCSQYCFDDTTMLCGSQDAISVYDTGQNSSSPPRRLAVTRREQEIIEIVWGPPDIPNGEIYSYTIKATALETYALYPLPPTETEVEGKDSNTTTLYGLQPGTKYNISITASNKVAVSDPTYIIDYTRIGPPEKPKQPVILHKNQSTITLEIFEGRSEKGPLSFYCVVVVQTGIIPPTASNISYDNFSKAQLKDLPYYIAGRFEPLEFEKFKIFTIGNGENIGGFYNPPLNLKEFEYPQVGVALESRIRGEMQFSYSELVQTIPNIFPELKHMKNEKHANINLTNVILWILIIFLSLLLLSSIVVFLILQRRQRRLRKSKLPEQQELTLQGPMYEIDNIAYIPEDVPERTNHYQELKSKVWIIPRNFLNFNPNYVRRGRFGTVHTGTVLKDGITLPVFIHKISDTQLKNSEKRQMLRELDICIKAGTFKYLASLLGNCETPEMLFVAMEMPAQCLKTRLLATRSGDNFPHNEILKIGSRIAEALRHLASLNIVHTHLCARSIGLSENNWIPKLMGHGLSKYELEDFKYARWTAVECFADRRKHQPGVVWAFGILLWEMFSLGGTPYSNLEMDSDVENALNEGKRLHQLMDIPDPIYEVMSSCWLACPDERPTFDELIRLETLTVCPITSITEPYRPELELN